MSNVLAMPCPFCGGNNPEVEDNNDDMGFGALLVCVTCGANIPGFGNTQGEATLCAIAKWNLRLPPKAPA